MKKWRGVLEDYCGLLLYPFSQGEFGNDSPCMYAWKGLGSIIGFVSLLIVIALWLAAFPVLIPIMWVVRK